MARLEKRGYPPSFIIKVFRSCPLFTVFRGVFWWFFSEQFSYLVAQSTQNWFFHQNNVRNVFSNIELPLGYNIMTLEYVLERIWKEIAKNKWKKSKISQIRHFFRGFSWNSSMTNSLLSLLKSHEPDFWIILILEEPSKVPIPFYTARSSKIPVFTHFHTLNFCPKNQRTSPRRICYFITWPLRGSVPHKIAWTFLSPLGVTEPPKNVLSPFRGTDPQKYPVSLKGYWPQKSSASLMGYWLPKMFSYEVANRPAQQIEMPKPLREAFW